jgi:hypothetical protein
MEHSAEAVVPAPGDRIEVCIPRLSGKRRGTIEYLDELQILVRWNDGTSGSLRRGVFEDRFSVVTAGQELAKAGGLTGGRR